MPIVNYVREHIRFMEYATDEHLTSSERLLWYALMHIMNQRAQGKVWPDEFIRISNDRLLSYCPMKYDTIAAARNSLKQRGLIEFSPGEKNKKSPAYRMIYFYPEYVAPDTESDADLAGYPKKSDYLGGNMGGNIGYNIGGNMGGKSGGNTGDFILNNTERYNRNLKSFEDDEEDEEDISARARAREEAVSAWKMSFGREPTPAIAEGLVNRAVSLGFEAGVLGRAIEMASRNSMGSPFAYICKVLADWKTQKVKTLEDAEEYSFIFDAYNGKAPGGATVEDGINMMHAFRQDRETAEEREHRLEYEAEEEERREERNRQIGRNKEARERKEYEEERGRLERKYAHVVNE